MHKTHEKCLYSSQSRKKKSSLQCFGLVTCTRRAVTLLSEHLLHGQSILSSLPTLGTTGYRFTGDAVPGVWGYQIPVTPKQLRKRIRVLISDPKTAGLSESEPGTDFGISRSEPHNNFGTINLKVTLSATTILPYSSNRIQRY